MNDLVTIALHGNAPGPAFLLPVALPVNVLGKVSLLAA